jgi:hypothetical protein
MHRTRSIVAALLAAGLLAAGGAAAGLEQTQPAQPVVVEVEGGGFHWEDAGLGAVGGVAATLLVLALVFTVRQSSAAPTASSIPHDIPPTDGRD